MEQIFLRNTLPGRPSGCRFPAAPGATLAPWALTGLPAANVRDDPEIRAAEAAGVLVAVLLPPPPGRPWRLAGAALRAPTSAAARHLLAAQAGMDGMVLARMALERQIEAARLRPGRGRQGWLEARLEREGCAAHQGGHRARIFYGALREACLLGGVPQHRFFAVLDGRMSAPAVLNGHAAAAVVLPPSLTERLADDGTLRTIRRYQRRTFQAARLIRAAIYVTGGGYQPGGGLVGGAARRLDVNSYRAQSRSVRLADVRLAGELRRNPAHGAVILKDGDAVVLDVAVPPDLHCLPLKHESAEFRISDAEFLKTGQIDGAGIALQHGGAGVQFTLDHRGLLLIFPMGQGDAARSVLMVVGMRVSPFTVMVSSGAVRAPAHSPEPTELAAQPSGGGCAVAFALGIVRREAKRLHRLIGEECRVDLRPARVLFVELADNRQRIAGAHAVPLTMSNASCSGGAVRVR